MSEIGSPDCNLGRKEYWDEFYAQELQNFQEFGDTGDIWFGKKNLERIVDWLLQSKINKSSPVLDIGCGNGMTLMSLAKVGFEDLTGVDYAVEAIELAKCIAKNSNVDIKFKALDFLNSLELFNSGILNQTFGIIIDKGTYDAVCLNPDNVTEKREKYLKQVQQLLSTEGCFLLFSCNWTKEELMSHFIGFKLYDEIKVPSIGFGGKTGQTVTALVMKKDNQIL